MTKEYPTTLEMAMLSCQTKLKNPIKDATNPHFKSKYASLPEIRNLVTPILADNGLYITQFIDGPVLKTFITHAPTQRSLYSNTDLMMERQTPQGQGSAITYARRYAICSMLNISADEDDDANSAEKTKPDNNALKNNTAVQADMKALGYDANAVYNAVIDELNTVTDSETLGLWVARNKETRRMNGMPDDLKDDIKSRHNTLKIHFQQKGI